MSKKKYLSDTPGKFVAWVTGKEPRKSMAKGLPGELIRGLIEFPDGSAPKKWSIHFKVQWYSAGVGYKPFPLMPSTIHVDHKDWRKRKDAGEIRRAIYNAWVASIPGENLTPEPPQEKKKS